MGTPGEKCELTSTSDLAMLQEKGFVLGKLIGEGSYAKVRASGTGCGKFSVGTPQQNYSIGVFTVYKAIHMYDETRNTMLACKVIDTTVAPRDYLTKFLPRELDILMRVNHPHIVHVSDIFQRRARYYIFQRYAENGDLLNFLTSNGAVPENQSRLWMRQLTSGLHYIHTLNIAHRDLKCENVLITTNYNVKITDFGFARGVRCRDRDVLSETFCGSLSYAAPEVLKGNPYLPKLADMWSMGIILYTMLNQALPFNETSARKLYEMQVTKKWRFRSSVVNQLSEECKKQVAQLMEPEAKARPTAGSIFHGPWIAMDPRLTKLTFLEESLLKQALGAAEKQMRNAEAETEMERIAEIRCKSRVKEGFKVWKSTDAAAIVKSKQMFDEPDKL